MLLGMDPKTKKSLWHWQFLSQVLVYFVKYLILPVPNMWPWILPFCVGQCGSVFCTRLACLAQVSITSWASLFLLFICKERANMAAPKEKLNFEGKKYFCYMAVDGRSLQSLQMERCVHRLPFQISLERCVHRLPFQISLERCVHRLPFQISLERCVHRLPFQISLERCVHRLPFQISLRLPPWCRA